MPRILALLALPLACVLGACSAESAVSSAVSSRVSSATASARQAAEQKATELAVQAFRSQACSLSADGRLSSSDLSQLRQGLDAAAAAGVPAQVVDAVRPLVARGRSATKAQVQRMHRQVCAG